MSDFRDAKTYPSERAANDAKIEEKFFPKWWQSDDPNERAKALIDTAKALETNSTERHQANLRFARMYENVELDTLAGSDFALALVQQAVRGRGLVRMNIVASVLDTLAAKIAKNKPKPTFLTSGGDWGKQQRARRLDRFCRGLFYEVDLYEKAKDAFFDGGEFGTGFLHFFFDKKGRLEAERAMPDEMFVDDVDAIYGSPRQLLRRKVMQREVALDLFPEHEAELYKAVPPKEVTSSNKARVSPTVEVWEAWHLPTSDTSGDGLHVIAIDGHELLCETWKLPMFPFVKLNGPCGRGGRGRTIGYWGKGVAEALTGLQIELNRLILSVSEQLRRKGRGRIFLKVGSKVNPNHLTNDYSDIVWYVGDPPVVDNQNAVAPEEFMQIDRIRAQAYQEVGISELSAAAKKPSGLDAAVALREFSDIESERFALIHQAWEKFFLDCAELALEMIRVHGTKGYTVKLPSKRYVQEINFDDIELERDAYAMQMFPSSSLPQTPAARYQKVTEMLNDGFIDKPTAQRLLEYPDIEAETNLGNAAMDDVDATISLILDEAEPKLLPLEKYQNIDLIISRGTAAYLFARHHECPEDRLDLLRQLIDSATAMKAATLMPPPGAVPGGPAAPAGVPMPTGPAPGMGAPQATGIGTLNVGGPQPTVPPMVAG